MAQELCSECKKRPVAIKKFGLCRACYARKRRKGEIVPYDPELSESDLGRIVLKVIDNLKVEKVCALEEVAKERSTQKELIEQNNFLAKENNKLKQRIIELQEELTTKKTRAVRLSDLAKLTQSDQ